MFTPPGIRSVSGSFAQLSHFCPTRIVPEVFPCEQPTRLGPASGSMTTVYSLFHASPNDYPKAHLGEDGRHRANFSSSIGGGLVRSGSNRSSCQRPISPGPINVRSRLPLIGEFSLRRTPGSAHLELAVSFIVQTSNARLRARLIVIKFLFRPPLSLRPNLDPPDECASICRTLRSWNEEFPLGDVLHVITAHMRRHLWQARQVTAAAGFPRTAGSTREALYR